MCHIYQPHGVKSAQFTWGVISQPIHLALINARVAHGEDGARLRVRTVRIATLGGGRSS